MLGQWSGIKWQTWIMSTHCGRRLHVWLFWDAVQNSKGSNQQRYWCCVYKNYRTRPIILQIDCVCFCVRSWHLHGKRVPKIQHGNNFSKSWTLLGRFPNPCRPWWMRGLANWRYLPKHLRLPNPSNNVLLILAALVVKSWNHSRLRKAWSARSHRRWMQLKRTTWMWILMQRTCDMTCPKLLKGWMIRYSSTNGNARPYFYKMTSYSAGWDAVCFCLLVCWVSHAGWQRHQASCSQKKLQKERAKRECGKVYCSEDVFLADRLDLAGVCKGSCKAGALTFHAGVYVTK